MKKNYVAIFQKAGKLTKKIILVFLIIAGIAVPASAQLSGPDNLYFYSSSKGPADVMTDAAGMDVNPPVITYTSLTNTCATGNRTLTATITDADGVPATGTGRPVLYWKINEATSYTAAPGTGGPTYTFNFGAGAVAGDVVYYYIVAQDNLGNVVAKPSAGFGGYTTNPPAAAIHPSPDFYVIQATLAAGTYTIGAGGLQSYLTITDAVNAYNNSCLNGPVTFLLMDASYDAITESFPITIGNPAANSTNTLTIRPNAGVNPTISGSSDAIFKLNGADYITIDGSNSGGTTRNLTIVNNSNNLSSNVIWVGSASLSNGATHNTIKNCTINGNAGNTTNAGIISSSGIIAGNVAETANSSNAYQNNDISKSYCGIVITGPLTGETGTVISSNNVGSTQAAKKLGYRGIVVSNETNVQVNNNTVLGVSSTFGLGSDTDPAGGIIVSGAISGGNIYSNIISDIKNTNIAGWQAYGISLQSTSPAAGIKVYNNFIHSITGNGNATNPANNGIGISIQSGGGYGIYFNSINLFANQPAGGISASVFIGPLVTGTASLDIRNNIFSNRRTTGINYAIYSSQPGIIFSNINYNDYYSTSFLGYLGSNRATIAAWQGGTGSDGNSVVANPIFISTTDLHLQPISPLNNQGVTIAGITTDIDGTTRAAVPDIGADDFTPPACTGNTGGTATADFSTICTSGSVSLSASGFAYGLGIAYQWEKSTDNFLTPGIAIAGETNPTSANPPVINVTTYYRLRVTCAAGTPGYSNTLTIIVYNPAIVSTTPGSRCGPGTVNLAATGTPATAIQWYSSLTGGAPIYTGSPFTTPSVSATTTYYAESVFLGSNGTVGKLAPSIPNNGTNTQHTSWDVLFNVVQATKLLTIDVYPLATGEFSVIDIYSGSRAETGGTIIASVPYTTLVSGGNTAQTITMNVALPIGTYYMYATNGIPASGLTRDLTGASYPYNSSDIVISGTGFLSPDIYMCYYNWRFSNGCSSAPRAAVTATVGISAVLNVTATPTAICAGSSTDLHVASSNTGFIYTWLPGSFVGPDQTVSPATTTTYTVNATDGTCTGTGNVTVTVNPASSDVIIAPAIITKCSNSPAVLLTASGGDITGIPILTEDFNGLTPPSGWTAATTYAPSPGASTGNLVACAWTLRPNNYNYTGNTFRSNDLSQFYLTNSDANTGITRTALTSPAFSLIGYTSASLSFWHYYAASGNALLDSICVEISQNGTAWTNIYSNHLGKGGSISFGNTTVSLNAYLGAATNYIRFRYFGNRQYWWALDNVSITGDNSGAPITWAPITGLYTNAAATPAFAYAGGVTTAIYASPAATTTYTATATPVNACQKSQTIDVIIRPVGVTLSASPGSVCPNGASTVSFALDGTGPWNLTYTDGITPVTVNNIATSPYTFVVTPAATTTYSLTALSDAYCTATPAELAGSTITVSVNPSAVSTWLGLSSDWTDLANWCGGIPSGTKDIVIPTTANSPVISVTTAVAHDINISNGASVTIDAGAMLSFKGIFVNDGTIINNGTIVLNGSTAQSFPGGTTGTITAMNDLEVNNAVGGATINKDIKITGTLKPTAGIITVNDTITLHSDIDRTANVSPLGATAGFSYGSLGKFVVERYISSFTRTGWRFLSVPTATTQTINEAWMEGQAPADYVSTGFGMQIVGPAGIPAGFDTATSTPSLKKYSPPTNIWVSVANTTGPIATTEGYMAFIRGDRGSHSFGSHSATTLRTSGPIKTGPVGPLSTASPNSFISVGNPYPSAIDFASTTRNGLQNTYYLWDPQLGTYGGYQVFTGPSYTATPGGGSYAGSNKFIESGQAFFVISTSGAAPHNISFSETNKVSGSFQVARTGSVSRQLRTQLSGISGSQVNLIDGVLIEFDGSYSNEVDDLDAPKLSNFGENISILTGGKAISVERHAEIVDKDTVFYQFGQLRQQQYQFEFLANDLSSPGLEAYLEDNYLHTRTAIGLDGSTLVTFSVNGDAGSSASNRFRIVFREQGVVPVTFTGIRADRQEKNILVSWKVENELNIDHYVVEHSVDGRHFVEAGKQGATGNGGLGSVGYSWLDTEPFGGTNFYRIKSIGIGNEVRYSEIVKVNMAEDPSMITLYPNPVKDGIIGLSFNNIPKGAYDITLFSSSGQQVLKQRLNHPGGSRKIRLVASPGLAKGFYTLEITLPKDGRSLYKLIVE